MYVHCRKLERGINLKFPCSPSLYTPLPRIGFHLTYLRLFHFLFRGYWKSFVDGLQRVLIFTPDEGVIDRIKAENSYSFPLFEASLAIRNIGISLVDNYKKRELAYIAITQWVFLATCGYSWIPDTQKQYRSGVIWQIDKGKKVWKNVSNSLNLVLEEAYQNKSVDVKQKNLSVCQAANQKHIIFSQKFSPGEIFVFPLTLFCFLAWMKFLSHRFICYVVMIV